MNTSKIKTDKYKWCKNNLIQMKLKRMNIISGSFCYLYFCIYTGCIELFNLYSVFIDIVCIRWIQHVFILSPASLLFLPNFAHLSPFSLSQITLASLLWSINTQTIAIDYNYLKIANSISLGTILLSNNMSIFLAF